jgi:hypothetical protein
MAIIGYFSTSREATFASSAFPSFNPPWRSEAAAAGFFPERELIAASAARSAFSKSSRFAILLERLPMTLSCHSAPAIATAKLDQNLAGARYSYGRSSPNPLPSKAFPGYSQPQNILREPRTHFPSGQYRENLCPALPLIKPSPTSAQNPVTRLWTACTSLKIKQIKPHTFD